MNNLIFFPSYKREEHGLLYGGKLYRGGVEEIMGAVPDKDWRRLYQRVLCKPAWEMLQRFGYWERIHGEAKQA